MTLREKLAAIKRWFFGGEEQLIQEIPDYDVGHNYGREEKFMVGYTLFYGGLLMLGYPLLQAYLGTLLTYVMSGWSPYGLSYSGWLVAAVLSNLVAGMAVILGAVVVRQQKMNYDHRLHQKATRYDCWRGEIREMTEEGLKSYEFQIFVAEVRRLLSGAEMVETLRKEWGVDKDSNVYLVKSAYVKETDLLSWFLVVTKGSLAEHEGIRKEEDVFVGLLGVERRVTKLNLVVARRVFDQRLLLYITDSYVTVTDVLNHKPLKVVEDSEVGAAQAVLEESQDERIEDEVERLQIENGQLRAQNTQLGRALMRKEQREKQQKSVILTPEPEEKPKKVMPLWQKLLIVGLVGTLAALGVWWFLVVVL